MVVRTITVRPENHAPGDPVADIVSRPHPAPVAADSINVTFGVPQAGWIDFNLDAGAQVLKWDLSGVSDAFGMSKDADRQVYVTFLGWLEQVASARPATMFIDMEGPNAVLLISAPDDDDAVEFLALGDPEGAGTLAIAMDRLALLREFCKAVIAAWEGQIAANWTEWSRGTGPQWSLRSPLIEGVLERR